jgi:hypothetical protein
MKSLFLVSLIVVSLLSGCASVSVIQPVALQNARNAEALHTNLTAFFSADEPFFRSAIGGQLIDDYREVIRSIQDDNPGESDAEKIAKYYESKAAALRQAVQDLSEEAKEIEISRFHREYPLTAAVAFSGMLPKIATGKWIGFESIHRSIGMSAEGKFALYQKQFKDLPLIEQREKAAADLMSAYMARRAVLLEQCENAKKIANQFVAASNANYDAGKFLQGVFENETVIEGITEYILTKSGDPNRKKAAEELLKAIAPEEKNPPTL